jgi:glycine cleavage system H protein
VDLSGHRFSQTHEWVRGDEARVRVGITDYAQGQLGDVIFVELPAVDTELSEGAKFGVIESVKAANDLYSPVSGKVVGVNDALQSSPELINNEPYGNGWMLEIEVTQPVSSELLDEHAYQKFVEGL